VRASINWDLLAASTLKALLKAGCVGIERASGVRGLSENQYAQSKKGVQEKCPINSFTFFALA
jgi:hypothetical protein